MSKAELANHLTTIKAVMQETIAKAQAGYVEGTREAEGKGDEAIEAIIKAVRPVDASLADSIEKLELDYEEQADSSNPDLARIAKDAQDVLPLLDQAASKLQITSSAGTSSAGTSVSKAELANNLDTAKTNLQETLTKASAGDRDAADAAFEEADKPLEAIVDALKPVDSALADSMEENELDLEDGLDATPPKLDVVADKAQDLLTMLDQAAAKLGITP